MYLEALAELGLLGLAFLLIFVSSIVYGLARARFGTQDPALIGTVSAGATAFCLFLVHAGVDWMWELTAVPVLALVCGGSALAVCHSASTGAPRWLRAAMAAGAAIACATQLPGLVSNSSIRRSQAAVDSGNTIAALAASNDAVAAAPWASTPFIQRGLVQELQGAFGHAKVDLRAAAKRDPHDWRPPLLLARVEAESGNTVAALRAWRQARSLRPMSPIFSSKR